MKLAILITGVVFITGIPFMHTPAEEETAFFSAFVIARVWNGMNCRGINGVTPPILRGNPPFFVIMGLIILVQVLIVQAGGTLFDTVPLSPPQWMIIIIGTMPVLFLWPLLRFFAGGKEGRISTFHLNLNVWSGTMPASSGFSCLTSTIDHVPLSSSSLPYLPVTVRCRTGDSLH